jgi:hypothetical protein
VLKAEIFEPLARGGSTDDDVVVRELFRKLLFELEGHNV